MSIQWKNIQYNVEVNKEEKNILKNLSGYVEINSMIAIMGPSGAGKSSLLNILSGFNKKYEGDVLINNEKNIKKYQKQMGYVHQEDLFKVNLTIYEHLYYIAKLKKIENEENKITTILEKLNLKNQKDSTIKNLSGGEKKRLSIASELLHDPYILFLDEPTSGLDSFMAKTVIQSLNEIKENRIIVMTIHQPSVYIYHIFDFIYLLQDGELIFNNVPEKSYDYFEEAGYICPQNENIAEFILETINSVNMPVYQNDNIQTIIDIDKPFYIDEHDTSHCMERFEKIQLLFHRNNKHFYRDPFLFKSQIFKNIFMIVIIGFLYFQLDNDENSIQSISGVMYFILINQAFNTLFPTIRAFVDDIELFKRENNNLYTLFDYYFSKVNGDIMFQIGTPIFLYTPIYFMIGLRNDAESFALSTTVMVLACLSSSSFGYLFGALVNNIDLGLIMMSVVILPLMIGGGFFINSDSIPIYFIWLKYVSFFKYAFENLMIIEWDGKEIDCVDTCYLSNGDDVLEFYNIDKAFFMYNIYILILYSFFFRVLTYFILQYKTYKMYNS